MKRFVKVISLVLTLAMVFSVMSVGAWADGNNTPAEQTKTVPVNVEKVWVDNNNVSGKRPVAISVVLKTGGEVVKTLELSANDDWKTQIELPANFDWTSSLTVEETTNGTNSLTNYVGSITTVVQPSADGFTIVTPDNEMSFTYNGVEMIVLTKGNDSYTWSSKKVDKNIVNVLDDSQKLTRFNFMNTTIADDEPDGYTFTDGENEIAKITVEDDGVKLEFLHPNARSMFAYGNAEAVEKLYGKITITNTYNPPVEPEKPTTSVTVVKEWANVPEGIVLPEVKVQLYANSEEYGKPVTLNKENDWKCTWPDLPKYPEATPTSEDQNLQPIKYTVDEVKVPEGYEKTITDAVVPAGIGFTITNTYNLPGEKPGVVTIEVPFTKVVKQGGNTEPGKTEFQLEMLTPDFEAKTIKIVNNTITTNGAGEYEGAFIFSISEDELDRLREGFVLKEVAVEDSNWNCDTTPWLVYVGSPAALSEEDVDSNLVVVTYEAEYVEEENYAGYVPVYDYETPEDIVFTNTYTENTVNPPVQEYDPEPTPKDKVVVKKVWVGDDEKTRPEEITVQLYKNGKKYEKPVKLSADEDIYENWRHVWDDVREDEDTVWSVKELNVPEGYSVSIEQRRSNYFIITNTLNEKPNPDTGASDFVGAAVALAVCSAVSGAALMLKRK